MKFSIGIDVSGGDHAPVETFKGAVLAQNDIPVEIVLIGDRMEIEQEASRANVALDQFTIVDAPEKISMNDSAAMSIRRKKKSSIVIGMNMLKKKQINAFVSCGNTGAVVSAATLMLGLIEEVERPGISILFPTSRDVSLMIDVGANVSPKPLHLLQYGIMSSVYYSLVFNKPSPTVGLLNIGEEEGKGSDFVKTVHRLFSNSSLNFIGNLEAKEIYSGECDCIVCDGFVGNIALKVSEGLVEMIGKLLKNSLRKDWIGKLGVLFMHKTLKGLKQRMDYSEYGGAPLLGVDGVVIIGHGRSNSMAVKNAVKVASRELEHDLINRTKHKLAEVCHDKGIAQMVSL